MKLTTYSHLWWPRLTMRASKNERSYALCSTSCTGQIYLHGVKSSVWFMKRGASTRKLERLFRSRVKLRTSQGFRADAPTRC
jgi:hypothetical protein